MNPASPPPKRQVWIGPTVIAAGVLHTVVGLVLFAESLRGIAALGVGRGTDWSMDMLAGFWFLLFGWPLVMLGALVTWTHRRCGLVPVWFGWGLAVPATLTLIVLPISGLWLFLPLGGAIVFATRTRAREATAATKEDDPTMVG